MHASDNSTLSLVRKFHFWTLAAPIIAKVGFSFKICPPNSLSVSVSKSAVEHLEADGESSGAASRGYSGSNLFDPENPDHPIDLSDRNQDKPRIQLNIQVVLLKLIIFVLLTLMVVLQFIV